MCFSDRKLVKNRILPLEGACNFRDMGNLPIKISLEGGIIEGMMRPNLLYRSGDLGSISDKDIILLENLNIKSIVDFREQEGREKLPDKKIGTVQKDFSFPIDCTCLVDDNKIKAGKGREAMMEFYRNMVEKSRPQFRCFFETIAEPGNLPLVFHCSAGKDRTGLAAAFVLFALGTPKSIIEADYVLSAECIKKKPDVHKQAETEPNMAPVINVTPDYLDSAFTLIEKNYGGLDNYFSSELKIDRKKIFDIYKSR
jgi:protein-tyrosine phosphatase